MKKLLLLAAFGLLASPAFAQSNTADVDQTGDQHTASVVQTGTDHEAYVDQISDGQHVGATADVQQLGTSQYAEVLQSSDPRRAYAEVRQDDGSGTGDNEAFITQSRSQDDSEAYVHQSGTSNTGTIIQDVGGINKAEIYQGQTDDTSDNNVATITQDREAASAYLTHAEVYQDGSTNTALVDQSLAQNAWAKIDQDGDLNWADIDQSNDASPDPNHQAEVRQDGDLNEAQILQEGTSNSRNNAKVRQVGDSNDAFLDQDGWGGSHVMQITQDGNLNKAGVSGVGGALFQSGWNHWLDVDQIGDSNVVTSIQTGDDHTATILQTGGMNTANVQQGN